MHRLLLGSLIFPVWLLIHTGLAGAQSDDPAPAAGWWELEEGQNLLQSYCASCHAIGRSGESPHTDAPQFRTLGQKYRVSALEEALAEGIMTGHPDMPVFQFDERAIRHIIAYLESIQVSK